MSSSRPALGLLAVATLLLPLAGCGMFDYLNRRDTVTLRAGDSVKANLEQQTINPSKASMYDTKGLGVDGDQIPDEEEAGGTSASGG